MKCEKGIPDALTLYFLCTDIAAANGNFVLCTLRVRAARRHFLREVAVVHHILRVFYDVFIFLFFRPR